MNNVTRILILLVICLLWLEGASAQRKSSATQTVTFSVQRSVRVAVAPLRAEAIGNEDQKSSNTASFVVENNAAPKKMTLALNSALPIRVPLEVYLNTPSYTSSTYLLTSAASEVPIDRQLDIQYRTSSNVSFTSAAGQAIVLTVTD